MLVQQSRGGAFPGVSDFALSQQLASTYTRLVKTTPFLQKVIIETDLPYSVTGLRSKISASTSTNPPVVEIVVSDRNSGAAATTANVVAQEFIDYIVEQRLAEIARLQSQAAAQGIVNVQDLVSAQLAAVNSLSLLEPVISASPVLPRIRQNVIISVIAGLILAIIIAFVLENLGDRVRSPEEISRRFGVTALGTIFQWTQQDAGTDELVLWKAPSSTYAESFRQVRANVQFATANQTGNIFLFCSPGPGEGKSTMTCNLAIALAQMGKKVIVIDGDLRRASVHKRFTTVSKEPGLSNYLADFTRDTATITHQSEVEGVSVIPAGPTPPNPSELLGSPKMSLLLGELKEQYDFILIDSPPILLVADGSILASQVNGVVVVVDGATTRSSSLQAALDMLRTTQVNIVGVVINKLKRARFGYGYGYPYYYYSYNGYYGTPESENGSLNGHRRFYHRPVDWVRSVFHHSDNIGS